MQREIYCAPGSAAIGSIADRVPIPVDQIERLADFATELQIDLTIVGPEQPLALGVVDAFVERGLPIFGPTREAAQLETSKVFAKQFMQRNAIPTARAEVAESAEQMVAAARGIGLPVALKADGLAAGKGVLLAHDESELEHAAAVFFEKRRFGEAGDRVLVEEFLVGQEVSFIALSDGYRLLHALRTALRRPDLPALLCTAEDPSAVRAEAAAAGFQGCLDKPVDASTVQRLMSHRRPPP